MTVLQFKELNTEMVVSGFLERFFYWLRVLFA
jgi:hypothetical protein